MSDFLQQMATSSAARVAAASTTYSAADLDRVALPLQLSGFDVIAEIKDRSPAEGELRSTVTSRAERARCYAKGGAAAISVLTEPDRCDGDLTHLEAVVDAVCNLWITGMRKDFLVDPLQILQAKAAGASGVLLIAAMLDDTALSEMLECAFEHDLFVLLESFDTTDLERSAHLLQSVSVRREAQRNKFLLGINTRDLRTLAVDPVRLKRFSAILPAGVCTVAESGQRTADDAAQVASWGYGMALVGTALMKARDPAKLIGEMLDAGRAQGPSSC